MNPGCDNITKLKDNKSIISNSFLENYTHNNNLRLKLQKESAIALKQQTKRYNEEYHCCDCSEQKYIIYNNGYACSYNNLKR